MNYERDNAALVRDGLADERLRGLFQNGRGEWLFDLRFTDEEVSQNPVLSPRTADMNIIGDYAIPVPSAIVTELGLDN